MFWTGDYDTAATDDAIGPIWSQMAYMETYVEEDLPRFWWWNTNKWWIWKKDKQTTEIHHSRKAPPAPMFKPKKQINNLSRRWPS